MGITQNVTYVTWPRLHNLNLVTRKHLMNPNWRNIVKKSLGLLFRHFSVHVKAEERFQSKET